MTLLHFSILLLVAITFRNTAIGPTYSSFVCSVFVFVSFLLLFDVSLVAPTKLILTTRLVRFLRSRLPQYQDHQVTALGMPNSRVVRPDTVFLNTGLPPPTNESGSHKRFVEAFVPAAAFATCCCLPSRKFSHKNSQSGLQNLVLYTARQHKFYAVC